MVEQRLITRYRQAAIDLGHFPSRIHLSFHLESSCERVSCRPIVVHLLAFKLVPKFSGHFVTLIRSLIDDCLDRQIPNLDFGGDLDYSACPRSGACLQSHVETLMNSSWQSQSRPENLAECTRRARGKPTWTRGGKRTRGSRSLHVLGARATQPTVLLLLALSI